MNLGAPASCRLLPRANSRHDASAPSTALLQSLTDIMKSNVTLAALFLATALHSLAVVGPPYYDSFAYTNGSLGDVGGSGGWDAATNANVTVTGGNLTGPAGLPAATGNMIVLSKGAGANYTTFANSGQITAGQVYFSFLFKPGSASGASSAGLDIAALSAQDGSSAALNLQLRNNSGFKLGLKKAGGTAVFPTSGLLVGTNYLVIGKYDFSTSPNTASLWILTNYASTEVAAGAAAVSINTGTDFSAASGLGRFYLNGAGVPTAAVNVDELRLGTSWVDVLSTNATPPPTVVITTPHITQTQHTGTHVILHGTNGTAGGGYEIICATNVNLPLNQWSVVGSNNFSGTGLFDCTNNITPGFTQAFYRLRIGGGGAGATNPPAGTPPTINAQPQDQSAAVGQGALFTVGASGSAPLTYQWFFNTNTPIASATNATHNIAAVSSNDLGNYRVIVANSSGSATSSVATLTISAAPTNGTWYVSPSGNDSSPGTLALPFATLGKAVSVVQAGQTIYLRGGTYLPNATINITTSGTASNRINLLAYPGEQPYLNFTNQPVSTANRGILFKTNANYWTVKGLEVGYAGDNGIKVEGSHHRFEQCLFHNNGDTGLQIGFGHTNSNPGGLLAAYVEVVNCDAWQNFDVAGNGGNADGFAAKMHCGQGIIFTGCRAWENSDDGWDLFETDYSVIISNCWTWKSAMIGGQGNGNGFKLGGDGAGGNSMGVHYVYNGVAFGCKVNNFTQNSHRDGEVIINCTAFSPGASGYNYFFEGTLNGGRQNVFKNNASIPRSGTNGGGFIEDNGPLEANNSWNLAVTVSSADFNSILETAAKAPRQPDGSLPTGFARLVAGSDLIDKGVNVGIPFNGASPDLGAFEYAP